MRKIFLLLCLVISLLGCGEKAKELFDTAQFEERQYNLDHARQLYQEIVDNFPESSYAAPAKERLKALASP